MSFEVEFKLKNIMQPELHKKALFFILLTVMIDSTGLGIIIPVMPHLIAETGNITINEASKYGGIIIASYAFMQFVFAPIVGGISDRYGRRPVLVLALIGLALGYLIIAFAPSLPWIIFGRCLSGIFGASFITATAYIADISEKENRAKNFGMVAAFFGLGFIIGPAIGGLVSSFGVRFPFYLASALSFLNVIYGFFVLKESLLPENRRTFDFKRANPFGALVLMKRKPLFLWLFIGFFVFYFADISVHSTWQFFTTEKFNWSTTEVGWSLATVGVAMAFVQGGLIGFFDKKFGNKKSVIISLIFSCIGYLGFTLASEGWHLYLFMLPYALGGIVEPTIKATMSQRTSQNEQGELQGAFASLISIASILSPLLMTGVYYYTTSNFNPPIYNSAYMLSTAIIFLTIPLVIYGYKRFNKR